MQARYVSVWLLLALALGACRHDSMSIQKEYLAAYGACTSEAEGNTERFQRCMESNRWQLSTEKVEKTEAGQAMRNRGVGIGVGPGYALERPGAGASSAEPSVENKE